MRASGRRRSKPADWRDLSIYNCTSPRSTRPVCFRQTIVTSLRQRDIVLYDLPPTSNEESGHLLRRELPAAHESFPCCLADHSSRHSAACNLRARMRGSVNRYLGKTAIHSRIMGSRTVLNHGRRVGAESSRREFIGHTSERSNPGLALARSGFFVSRACSASISYLHATRSASFSYRGRVNARKGRKRPAKGAINSDLSSRYAVCVVPIYQPVLSLTAKQRLRAYPAPVPLAILHARRLPDE